VSRGRDPAWWAPFIRQGRRPPLSGLDLPGDYSKEWIPTPRWSTSVVENGVGALRRARAVIDRSELVQRAWLMRHWIALETAYSRLVHVRERAIARARAIVAQGGVPQRPRKLINARATELAAFTRLMDRIGKEAM
jgi:hypothetical protein